MSEPKKTISEKESHHRIEQRKAKKRHVCVICGKDILPGCQYIHESYKAEKCGKKKYITFGRHIHCDAMMEAWIRKYHPEYLEEKLVPPVLPSEMAEDIQEHVCGEVCREFGLEQMECKAYGVYTCAYCINKLLQPHLARVALESVEDLALKTAQQSFNTK